jgi:hypothetical protein
MFMLLYVTCNVSFNWNNWVVFSRISNGRFLCDLMIYDNHFINILVCYLFVTHGICRFCSGQRKVFLETASCIMQFSISYKHFGKRWQHSEQIKEVKFPWIDFFSWRGRKKEMNGWRIEIRGWSGNICVYHAMLKHCFIHVLVKQKIMNVLIYALVIIP